MTLKDWADVAQSIAVAGAGVAAIVSLFMWRIEARRKFEWELARRVLTRIYELRDAIRRFRSPFMNVHTMTAQALGELGSGPMTRPLDENLMRDMIAVDVESWKPVGEAFLALSGVLVEVEAAWGEKTRAEIAPLLGLQSPLFWAQETLIVTGWGDPIRARLWSKEEIENARKTIGRDLPRNIGAAERSKECDEYGNELEETVSRARQALLPKMRL